MKIALWVGDSDTGIAQFVFEYTHEQCVSAAGFGD